MGVRESLSHIPSESEWNRLYDMADIHSLLAVAMGAVEMLPEEMLPDSDLLVEWYGQSRFCVSDYRRNKKLSAEFAELLAKRGIQCVVLKGLGVSSYYPKPEWREFGDFDCFLLKDGRPAFEEGMRVAREIGAEVYSGGSYKHEQIRYKGLLIENHQFISNFDETRTGIRTEEILRNAIVSDSYRKVEGTEILIPPAHFMALHLLKHSLDDFLNEGLLMRQVYDWAVFLKAEQENVDWDALNRDLEECRLKKFCDVLTLLCVKYLGLELKEDMKCSEACVEIVEEVLEDTLQGKAVYEKNETFWQKVYRIFVRRFRRMWRFRELASESYPVLIWKAFAFSSYLGRKVEL